MWAFIVILAVAVVLAAAVYYKRQHRHDPAGPDFHDPLGDNWRGQIPHI